MNRELHWRVVYSIGRIKVFMANLGGKSETGQCGLGGGGMTNVIPRKKSRCLQAWSPFSEAP